MAQPVWTLSVDLQTKTATFQSGMAQAAKTARGAFQDIKSGAGDMGREVGSSSGSARQAVMLLGNEFGVHLPRGLTTFVSSLGPVGPALEAAFPFAAIALGATLILMHLAKLRAEGKELTQDQIKFGTAAQNAFNSLDEKLLQAQKRSAELKNDHLGALHKELELIDKQSMAELVQEFGVLSKAADEVFAHLDRKWYQFGAGSAGAKNALQDFGVQYDALVAKGDTKGASALLAGTKRQAEHILDMQKQLASTDKANNPNGITSAQDNQRIQALNELKKFGAGLDKTALDSQQALVQALNDQMGIEQRVSAQKKQDQDNAKTTTAKEGSAQASEAARAAAESQLRIAQLLVQGDRATAEARLAVSRASIAERQQSDLAFAQRELDIELQGNKAQIAALNKMAADYPNALKALHEKAEELTAQHARQVAEITAKGTQEQAAKDLADIEQSIRAGIEATDQGTAARIAAIDAGLKREESLNMQDLGSYRELQTQRVQAARQMAEEQSKLAAEAGREQAENAQKMGELALAAAQQHQALLDSARRVTIQQRMQEEINAANSEYALKLTAAAQEAAALDKSGKDYENKLKAIQDRQRQLVQEHENEITAIKDKAEEERNQRILGAENRFNSEIAAGLTQTLMGHRSFAATMNSLGEQVASGMMQTAAKSIMANDFTKESDAAAAARKAYLAGMHFPFPANIVMGPALGALAFASVMAFQDGTDMVPGSGRGDKIPAMLEPGEGVVPGGVMDGLRSMARSGQMGSGPRYHIQPRITIHASALDADGMDNVLAKHGDKIQKHVENAVRKLNR